ncbi:hypothetical protein EXN66_Car012039 [Channa argus]|uniref:Uncharacterized protein n=1 Tax=Channa argus TaxID=215402 RepID=A0A6G1Q1I2_CHAAH|nr:hypothetical protein EXN66_Car012039 [Channa argus]
MSFSDKACCQPTAWIHGHLHALMKTLQFRTVLKTQETDLHSVGLHVTAAAAAFLCTADESAENKSHRPPQNITMVTRPRADRETPVAIATVTEQDCKVLRPNSESCQSLSTKCAHS